jgi:hypothetical protein
VASLRHTIAAQALRTDGIHSQPLILTLNLNLNPSGQAREARTVREAGESAGHRRRTRLLRRGLAPVRISSRAFDTPLARFSTAC